MEVWTQLSHSEPPLPVLESYLMDVEEGGPRGLSPAHSVKPCFPNDRQPTLQDPKHFKSEKTGRGQLREGWRDSHQPIMCSYKLVTVKFEVWGLQTRVEQFVHKVVRDILLIGHRQAFAWVDEWYDMTMDEVREFERATQEATNKKIGVFPPAISISSIPLLPSSVRSAPSSAPSTPLSTDAPEFLSVPKDRPRKKSAPETLTLPDPEKKATLNLPGIHSSDKPCRPKSE
ncbi:cytoplasmic phosphatidylinositol transfer protein 1 isoform X5 [Delphinapterus leucas]|uniref:Cytoplasmic phosphatidylinositol transfer protein 1 isoform X5 n=1 Tax=Delphinapterus leucas TaxID=9749 RepID=A0A2Y9PNP4_DELLE|nr:cytoplasmic phosphatidylinositol transfer protein 1 isoform X5 [Delphinapterus leucas]